MTLPRAPRVCLNVSPARLGALVIVTALAWATPARAWSNPCHIDAESTAEEQRAALFSEFKDNYFITGKPWAANADPGQWVRFQVSIKFNLVPTRSRCTLFFTFTQKTLWTLWTKSPYIQDANYNPAFFLAWREHDFTTAPANPQRGLHLLGVYAGYEHESNGRGGVDARGWDRLSAFARIGYYFGGGWHLVAEPKAWKPFIPDDDPAGFLNALGYGQLSIELGEDGVSKGTDPDQPGYVYRDFVIGALGRPGAHFDRGYLETWVRFRPVRVPSVSWSLFVQGAMGYAETLSRFDQNVPFTIRAGIALDDRMSIDAYTAGMSSTNAAGP